MNPILLALTLTLSAAAPTVTRVGSVTVTQVLAPHRELNLEVMVPGSRDSVWAAFTTSAGLETWLWRDCTVDLRRGGDWTVNYPGGKTGGGRIERYRDRKDITLHAMAPEWFPTVRRVGTTAAFSFEAVGDSTRVRLRQTGWQSGAEWDSAYTYLAHGNAQLLGQLRYRFVKGPIDWDAVEKRQASSTAK